MRHAFLLDGIEHEVWLSHDGDRWRLHAGEPGDAAAGSAPDRGARAPKHPSRACGSAGPGVPAALELDADGSGHLTIAGRRVPVTLAVDGDTVHVHLAGETWSLTHRHPLLRAAAEAHGGERDEVHAPMPGTVVSVSATAGDTVGRGDTLLVIESMKLETTISAWRDGVVEKIHVAVGQVFDRGACLASLRTES